MILYIFLFLISISLVLFFRKEFYTKLGFVILGSIYVLRDAVAVDDNTYIKAFQYINNGWDYDIEFSYKLLSKFAYNLGMNYKFIFLVFGFLSIYFLYKGVQIFCRTNTEKAIFLASFFGCVFVTSMSVMRQFLAACIIFYAFALYTKEKSDKKIILLILFASCFHYTSFIAFLFYILLRFRLINRDINRANIVLLCVILGKINIIGIILDKVWFLLPDSYQIYSNDITGSFSSAGGTLQIVLLILFCLVSIINGQQNSGQEDMKNTVLKTGQMLYLSINFLCSNNGVVSRLGLSFIPFIATLPYMFSKIFVKRDQIIIRIMCIICMLMLLIITLNSFISSGSSFFIPYKWSLDFFSNNI